MVRVTAHPLVAIALLAQVASAQKVAVSHAGSVAPIEDIPISTASAPARSLFETGQKLLDAGRPREAREHFRLAVEADPTFAYGYIQLAAASASAPEFKENLDRAAHYIAGKSDGERISSRDQPHVPRQQRRETARAGADTGERISEIAARLDHPRKRPGSGQPPH
jgi:hypothetical protein